MGNQTRTWRYTFTITSLKGMNPQYSFNGTMDNTFVTARVYTLGVNLKF